MVCLFKILGEWMSFRMMLSVEIFLILIGWVVVGGSPGLVILVILGVVMGGGCVVGFVMVVGVVVGFVSWGVVVGLGMSVLMLVNVWIFEIICYFGVGYLFYLVVKFLRFVFKGGGFVMQLVFVECLFVKGFLIYIINFKVILVWGVIYVIVLFVGVGVV